MERSGYVFTKLSKFHHHLGVPGNPCGQGTLYQVGLFYGPFVEIVGRKDGLAFLSGFKSIDKAKLNLGNSGFKEGADSLVIGDVILVSVRLQLSRRSSGRDVIEELTS